MSRLPRNYFLELYLSGEIDFESYLYFKQNLNMLRSIESKYMTTVCPCCGALLPQNTIDCFWCDWEGK